MSRFVGKAGFYLDRQLFPSSVEMSLGRGGGGGGVNHLYFFPAPGQLLVKCNKQ